MTEQQHKDMLRLQATLEVLALNVSTAVSVFTKQEGNRPHPDVPKTVAQTIDTLYQRLCAERNLS